jgi:hypothetical protein
MGLYKDQLVADLTTPSDGDSVVSYTYSGDGTAITETSGALDVNVANAADIEVAVNSEYAEDSAHTTGDILSAIAIVRQDTLSSLVSTDGDYGTMKMDSLGRVWSNSYISGQAADLTIADGGNSITVDFTRLLDSTDSVAVGDGAGNFLDVITEDAVAAGGEEGFMPLGIRRDADTSPVSADGDYHPFVFEDTGRLKTESAIVGGVADDAADSGNPIKIGSKSQFSVLGALSTTGDRGDLVSDKYRRPYMSMAPNVASKVSKETVGATAAEIIGTPSAGRQRVLFQNISGSPIYLGFDNTVTTSGATQGFRVRPNMTLELPMSENIDVWAISTAASKELICWELG